MKLKIIFYPGSQWEGGGMLPARLQDFSRLAEWISRFLVEVNDIRVHYVAALSNDGMILGQEKANLVKEIDDVIAGLLLFRRYLMVETPDRIVADDGKSFKYNIQISDSLWSGNGELPQNSELDRMSFSDLHNNLIPKKIRIIFARYGAAVGDNHISAEERDGLHAAIDSLIGSFFRIERKLLHD